MASWALRHQTVNTTHTRSLWRGQKRITDVTEMQHKLIIPTSNSPRDASSNYSHFAFSNNIRVKSLVWNAFYPKTQTETSDVDLTHQISDKCWHTKHSESHCASVEQSVLCPALQMDRHTVVLLFKERRMKAYSYLKRDTTSDVCERYVKDFSCFCFYGIQFFVELISG